MILQSLHFQFRDAWSLVIVLRQRSWLAVWFFRWQWSYFKLALGLLLPRIDGLLYFVSGLDEEDLLDAHVVRVYLIWRGTLEVFIEVNHLLDSVV